MSRSTVAIELIGNAGRLLRELETSTRGVRKFGGAVKAEFAALRGAATSLQGKLAGLGLSLGAMQIARQSALLDKELTQIGQTAGASKEQVRGLRAEIFAMSKQGGQRVEGLKDGFNNLIQAGQSWNAAMESTRAISVGTGVTGADGGILAGGLTVGAEAFNIDLEKPGKALELLDKMAVAGRLGNAELENLASIFARVGVNAAAAGMDFDRSLGFIETLSLVERNPERLATMADSTLRLFTNLRYMGNAQKATGVRFFDAQGQRRDAVAVLRDIKQQYDRLTTDRQRAMFVQRAFGEADLDTIKGMRTLLAGDSLDKIEEFAALVARAGGTLQRDFKEATENAVDQAGRLRNTLREAADDFARPVKETFVDAAQWALDRKEDGGLGLSGKQLLGGGAALLGGAIALARYGGPMLGGLAGRLMGSAGSTAAGIATGKAVEAATGVQPVFVTNWPDGFGTGAAANLAASAAGGGLMGRALPMLQRALPVLRSAWSAVAAAGPTAAVVGATAAAGYGVGSLLNAGIDRYLPELGNAIGDLTNRIAALFGSEESRQAIEINMQIDQAGRAFVEADDVPVRSRVSLGRGEF